MSRKRQHPHKRQQKTQSRPPIAFNLADKMAERKSEPKKEYGLPFILMEDENLNTFHYLRGAWVPYQRRIAECRIDCQVKALPQKLNKMTRYEVRAPLN